MSNTPEVALRQPEDSPNHHSLFTDYGCYEAGADYIRTHYHRYVQTLDLLGAVGGRVLELGASNPFAFTLMLGEGREDMEIWLAGVPDDTPKTQSGTAVVEPTTPGIQPLEFPCSWFNVETDRWPYEDASFDAVLCMELFEHLMIDPFYVFLEANRVLRPGGVFVLTTPNIVSYASVARVLSRQAPYLFGVFSLHGAYGRHNREWAPSEIASLGALAGFDTDVLDTRDLYIIDVDTSDARSLLAARGDDGALRGHGIFYRGVRARQANETYPAELYDYQPGEHRADVSAVVGPTAQPGELVRVEVRAKNLGSATWESAGPEPTRIGFQLLSADGNLLLRDYCRAELARPVSSGESAYVLADVPAPQVSGSYGLRIDLVHEHVCWFADTQRGDRRPVLPLTVVDASAPSLT